MRTRRVITLLMVLLAALLTAATVDAARPSRQHGHAKHPARPRVHQQPKTTGAVAEATKSTRRRAGDPGVTIADFLFSPGTITIHVGDTIVWSNKGPSAHTATANNGSFDTGVLSKGKSASVTFHSPGTFDYHCSIHPFMHGAVVVLASTKTSPKPPKGPSHKSPSQPSSSPGNSGSAPASSSPTSSSPTNGQATLPMTGANVLAVAFAGVALAAAGLLLLRFVPSTRWASRKLKSSNSSSNIARS
jgi:plastocyanin